MILWPNVHAAQLDWEGDEYRLQEEYFWYEVTHAFILQLIQKIFIHLVRNNLFLNVIQSKERA